MSTLPPHVRACCRPPEFAKSGGYEAGMASQAAEQLAALGVAESDEDEGSSSAARRQAAAAAAPAAAGEAAAGAAGEAAGAAAEGGGDGYASSSGSEDSLPPIPRFNNRKVIEYAVSSDSEDE